MKKSFFVYFISFVMMACNTSAELSADEQVRRALNATITAPFYTVDAGAASSLFPNVTSYSIQYQAPDRYHLKMVNGPEVIVINNQSWGYEKDSGAWIVLAKPNPDPKTLLSQFEPGEVTGFVFIEQLSNCNLFKANLGGITMKVCVVPKTGHVWEIALSDEYGTIDQLYDFEKPVSVVAPI